jgi:hypothetical protein
MERGQYRGFAPDSVTVLPHWNFSLVAALLRRRTTAMGFFEALIRALIYLCCIALCFFLCVWVLGELGIALPAMVIVILKVIFVLIAILILVRLFAPFVTGFNFFPPK